MFTHRKVVKVTEQVRSKYHWELWSITHRWTRVTTVGDEILREEKGHQKVRPAVSDLFRVPGSYRNVREYYVWSGRVEDSVDGGSLWLHDYQETKTDRGSPEVRKRTGQWRRTFRGRNPGRGGEKEKDQSNLVRSSKIFYLRSTLCRSPWVYWKSFHRNGSVISCHRSLVWTFGRRVRTWVLQSWVMIVMMIPFNEGKRLGVKA